MLSVGFLSLVQFSDSALLVTILRADALEILWTKGMQQRNHCRGVRYIWENMNSGL